MVVGEAADINLSLAFEVLDYALLSAPGAPLKQALLDAKIGKDIYGSFEDGIKQTYFSIVAKGANLNQKEEFIKVIRDTLTKIAEEGIDKKANGILNMRFICSATKRIGRKTEKRYGVPCPNPYASEWKLELMAREVFRTVWKDRRTEVLKTVRAVNTYLGVNKTDTEAEQLMSQREMWNRAYDALALERVEKRLDFAEFVTKSNEIAAHIAEIDKALMELSHTAEPVNRFDVEKIEAVLSERIAYPEGKIDPDALKNYVARIIKSNDRYVWLLSLAERLRPEQTQKIAMMQMVTYNGNAIGNEEKPTSGKTEIPDMEFLRRGQNGFILNATRYRRARLTERLFASETALPNEPIPLLQFEIDYPMAYQYQKEQGSATHPGRWQNLEVEVYLI